MYHYMYNLIYTIDITGDWISENGFREAYKRIYSLQASLPKHIRYQNELQVQAPPFDPDAKTAINLSLYLHDEVQLKLLISLLNNYCDLCFLPIDTNPVININQ